MVDDELFLEHKVKTPRLETLKSKYKDSSSRAIETDNDNDLYDSLTYEQTRKSRVLKCLSFNLLCQILVIISVLSSIFILPWLHFNVSCLSKNACSTMYLSIFFAWYTHADGKLEM